MSSSDRQIAANRLNAQRRTEPRTPARKAKVSVNALKHGLTARDVMLPNENADDFESFRADLLTSLAPHGALEAAFAEKIVADAWRLCWVVTIEAALYKRGFAELLVRRARIGYAVRIDREGPSIGVARTQKGRCARSRGSCGRRAEASARGLNLRILLSTSHACWKPRQSHS